MRDIVWRKHGNARVWSGTHYDAAGLAGRFRITERNVGTIRQDEIGWFHLYPLAGFYNGAPSIPLTGLRTIEEAQDAATVILSLRLKETQ